MQKSTEFLRQINLSQLKKKNQALKKFVERKITKKYHDDFKKDITTQV